MGGMARSREEQLLLSFILQINFSHLQILSAILCYRPSAPADSPGLSLSDSVMARNTLSKHQLVAHLLQLRSTAMHGSYRESIPFPLKLQL